MDMFFKRSACHVHVMCMGQGHVPRQVLGLEFLELLVSPRELTRGCVYSNVDSYLIN